MHPCITYMSADWQSPTAAGTFQEWSAAGQQHGSCCHGRHGRSRLSFRQSRNVSRLMSGPPPIASGIARAAYFGLGPLADWCSAPSIAPQKCRAISYAAIGRCADSDASAVASRVRSLWIRVVLLLFSVNSYRYAGPVIPERRQHKATSCWPQPFAATSRPHARRTAVSIGG